MIRAIDKPSLLLSGVLSVVLGTACSKGNKSDSDPTTTTTTSKTTQTQTETSSSGVTTANALSVAFPGSLALTVFPTDAGSTTLRFVQEAFDPTAKNMAEKVADQEAIAAGTADSCLPDALGKQFTKDADESCYEFDQDMIYGTSDTTQVQPRWLGARDGKSSNGEACLVAFTRNQVSQVVAMVDQTLGFGMAAICQHKKLNADVALPDVGASLDLAPALTDLFADKVNVTSATLERLEDSNNLPVYRILIKVKMGADSIQRTVGIIHSPKDDENKEYSGTLYTIMEGVPSFSLLANPPAGGGLPPVQNQGSKYQMLSITYDRSLVEGATKLRANLRSGQVDKAIATGAINSSGVLDLNVGTDVATGILTNPQYGAYADYPAANDAVSGITYVAFDLDADTNEGTLAYWKNPGGNYFENARGFNISIAKNADTGVLEGCATSGAASTDFTSGISIRRYLNEREAANNLTLEPKGFWHPFMNTPSSDGTDDKGSYLQRSQQSGQISKWYKPEIGDATLATTFASAQDGSLITRQCFARDADTGLYLIDTAAISTAAGYEVLDTGNSVNSAKFIRLPVAIAPPAENVVDAE